MKYSWKGHKDDRVGLAVAGIGAVYTLKILKIVAIVLDLLVS